MDAARRSKTCKLAKMECRKEPRAFWIVVFEALREVLEVAVSGSHSGSD
jgi:hypothetical protein